MAEDGYYELQVLDRAGWTLRSRFPTSADDPMVVMRARAEAEQATQEAEVRGVELTYEFMDGKTNEVRREAVFSWGSARAAPAAGPISTASSRRQILRTARAEGRVRPAHGGARRPARNAPDLPDLEPPEVSLDAADALPASAARGGRPWWRHGAVLALGSLVLAAGATAVIWIGLAHRIESVATVDPRPVQAGLFTVILLFCLGVLVWVQRRGIAALLSPGRAPKPAVAASAAPAVIEIPAPVPPAGPVPRPMAAGDAVVEMQQARLLRFLRDCLMHKDMRAAFASDNKLTDPHIVHGVHLFMLGAGEVCVTDTASGISDRSHLVKVMKALMRAIGSPEDRAEAFVSQLESYRKKPEEHTMILLGQLAMDHYLQSNQVEDGVLSKALTRWASPHGE